MTYINNLISNDTKLKTPFVFITTKDGIIHKVSSETLTGSDTCYDGETLVNGNVTTIKGFGQSNAKTIQQNAFNGCSSNLARFELPSVTDIGISAFYGCSKLTHVDIHNIQIIRNNAFENCTNLSSSNLNIKGVAHIGNFVFRNCPKIEYVDNKNQTFMGNHSFRECTGLKYVNLPNLTTIGEYDFTSCTNLVSAFIPQITSLHQDTFNGCSKLEYVDLRSVTTSDNEVRVFLNCTSLKEIHLESMSESDVRAKLSTWNLTTSGCKIYCKDGATIVLD